MRVVQPYLLLLVATLGMCSAFRLTLMSGPRHRRQIRPLAMQSTSSLMLYASPIETTVATDQKRRDFIRVLWDFSRPHTVIGSVISIVTLFMFAVPPNRWGTMHFMKALLDTLVPSVLMNLYITGLNQISDIDIDKVNKPYLPIASGELSKSSAIAIVLAALTGAAASTAKAQWPLFSTVWGSFLLGTLYSLPPFRLKRFPILAAFCILIVRGSLVNFGFFSQAKAAVLGSTAGPLSIAMRFPESLLVTVFFAVFGLVIAIMKDVPDVQGDKLFEIPSFSVKKGASLMFSISWKLLFSILYGTATCIALATACFSPVHIPRHRQLAASSISSLLLAYFAVLVRSKAKVVDTEDSEKVFKFYMFVWKIFYSCYLLLPLLALGKVAL